MAQPEIKGNIEFMGLGTLLSVHCNEQLSGRFVIESDATEAEIFLEQGDIIHARINSEVGEEAFHKIFAVKKGFFSIYPNEKSPQKSITKSWSKLLLDSIRMLDEDSSGSNKNINWDEFDIFGEPSKAGTGETSQRLVRLLSALQRLNGIKGVTILSPELEIIGNDGEHDDSDYLPLIKTLYLAVQKLGDQMGAGPLRHIVFKNFENFILICSEKELFFLLTEKTVISDMLMNEVYKLIKRYR